MVTSAWNDLGMNKAINCFDWLLSVPTCVMIQNLFKVLRRFCETFEFQKDLQQQKHHCQHTVAMVLKMF